MAGIGLAGGYGAQAGALALKEILEERVKQQIREAEARQREFENQRRVEEFAKRQALDERQQGHVETQWGDMAPQRTANVASTQAGTQRTLGVEGREAAEAARVEGLRPLVEAELGALPTQPGRMSPLGTIRLRDAFGIDGTTPGADTALYGPGTTAGQAWNTSGRDIEADRERIRSNEDIRVVNAREAAQQSGSPAGTPATSPYADERSNRVIESVDALLGKVNNWTTGLGSMAAAIPGTEARDFKAELATLTGNIAFNELAQMREASKTGGALGAISERELDLLSSALGALDAGQSPENLRQQLTKVKESIQRWQSARAQAGGAAPAGGPAAAGPAPRRRWTPQGGLQ